MSFLPLTKYKECAKYLGEYNMKTNEYPKVVGVEMTEGNVIIRFEGVLTNVDEPWRQKTYPLTLNICPHEGGIYVGASNYRFDNKLTLDQHIANGFYIKFEKEK